MLFQCCIYLLSYVVFDNFLWSIIWCMQDRIILRIINIVLLLRYFNAGNDTVVNIEILRIIKYKTNCSMRCHAYYSRKEFNFKFNTSTCAACISANISEFLTDSQSILRITFPKDSIVSAPRFGIVWVNMFGERGVWRLWKKKEEEKNELESCRVFVLFKYRYCRFNFCGPPICQSVSVFLAVYDVLLLTFF